ncbi:4a-hydroxytetrahydrobiopterin dehydratase [Pseudorhodoferax soli]|uniref:Putative pterin-4-alpha-carbinolamine dehydratase n=1 Tax=Pseudorhodoferax soli TaxID=545864 RepID=A0A368Y9B0_9BURK|nr:4a-hydroxytetrahydrobiopterin dehydratase [Pseudorhodoferax soli]RCW76008.1 4a-hydroxytetrahydrobiopterin dehydratase [Pseudorhodoferax soli]
MSTLPKKDWATTPRRALKPTDIVTRLAQLQGWTLRGDGENVAIEKTYRFANYHETMAFVNAVAFVAHVQDHHPELLVRYDHCVVALNTHDVHGISETDFDCAARFDALLQAEV